MHEFYLKDFAGSIRVRVVIYFWGSKIRVQLECGVYWNKYGTIFAIPWYFYSIPKIVKVNIYLYSLIIVSGIIMRHEKLETSFQIIQFDLFDFHGKKVNSIKADFYLKKKGSQYQLTNHQHSLAILQFCKFFQARKICFGILSQPLVLSSRNLDQSRWFF